VVGAFPKPRADWEERMKKLFMLLTVVVALNLQLGPAHAIPLGTLIDTNGQIVQGDKLFTNFELSNIVTNSPIIPGSPDLIEIQGVTNILGEHGLRLLGPFQATSTPADFQGVLGFFLEYDVTVTDPQFLIHDSRHAFSFTSIGSGSVNLTNQAGFSPTLNADNIQSVEGFGDNGVVNEEQPFFNNVSSQHMFHLIEFRAETTNPGGVQTFAALNVSSIDLTFSQTAIPEPSTWLLLGTGIAGFALWRRHRK
jgi:hypothetical protein